MKIQELEKELNITRSNIRFYEKEGLISPPRKENGYREYSEDDIAKLKKIIIFRKLGISVADIKSIFDGTLSLQTAIDNNIERLHKEIEELNGAIEVCEQIKEDNSDEKDFPQDHFWNVINSREKQGEKFNETVKDYIDFELGVFKEVFGSNPVEEKKESGIKGVLLSILIACLISGVFFCGDNGMTFWQGCLYPFFMFLLASIVLLPLYYLARHKPKLANIVSTTILVLGGLFVGSLVLLCIIGLFNTIFE